MSFKIIFNKFKSALTSSLPMPFVNKATVTMTPSTTCTTAKLSELRKLMVEHSLTAYYVPSEDAHQVKANLDKVIFIFIYLFICAE